MKNQTKRILAIFLSLAMVACLLPVTVFAETGDLTSVYVGGVQMKVGYYLPSGDDSLTDSNLTTTVPATGGYAYMEDATTLVLNGFSFEGKGHLSVDLADYQEYAAVYIAGTDDVTVELVGNNTFTAVTPGPLEWLIAIDTNSADADVAITGGSITIDGFEQGIYANGALSFDSVNADFSTNNEPILVEKSVSITDSEICLVNEEDYDGIHSGDGVAIENSKIDISSYDCAIYSDYGEITISNSDLTLESTEEYGLYTEYADANIIISDSNVNISSWQSAIYLDEGELTITNSMLDAYSDIGTGIVVDNNSMTVSDSELTSISDYYGGIYVYDDVTFENSKVVISASDGYEGLCSDEGSIDLINCDATITTSGDANAIYAALNINIVNSVLNASTEASDAIYAEDILTIVKSTVNVKSDSYSAAYAENKIVCTDSLLIAQTLNYDSAFDELRPDLSASELSYRIFAGDDENAPEVTDLESDWHLEKYVKIVPDIILLSGDKGEHTKKSGKDLQFKSNATFDCFIEVKVDGATVADSNYAVKEGSTVVTLLPAYLDTLAVGKHTLDIVSSNGTATGEFTIIAAPATPAAADEVIANTADTNNIASLGFLFLASTAAVTGLAVVSSKKNDD